MKQERGKKGMMEWTIQSSKQPRVEELKRIISNLEGLVISQKGKRQQVEERFIEYRNRILEKERQFIKVVHNLQKRRSGVDENHKQIDQLYERILQNFELSNQVTNRYLEDKYKQIEQLMNRNIAKMLSTTEQELSKNSQLSKESKEVINKEIRLALKHAYNVERDYYQMREQLKGLTFRHAVLLEEKNFLIAEVVELKNKIRKKDLVKVDKKLHFHNSPSDQVETDQINLNTNMTLCSTPSIPYHLRTAKINRTAKIHTTNPAIKTQTCKQADNLPQSKSALSNPQRKFTSSPRSLSRQRQCLYKALQRNQKLWSLNKKNVDNHCNQQTIQNERFACAQFTRCERCCCDIASASKHMTTEKAYTQNKTIVHLEKVLKRQREKSAALKSQLAMVVANTHEINKVLSEILLNNKNSADKLKDLVRSQKLIQTIKALKRRLTIVQIPSVASGWGAQAYQQLTQFHQEQTQSHQQLTRSHRQQEQTR